MLDVKEGIEQHPGHFQPKQCYIPYSETLRNSVKYSKNPVNHPFKHSTDSLNNKHIFNMGPESASSEPSDMSHPWPYLKNMFEGPKNDSWIFAFPVYLKKRSC